MKARVSLALSRRTRACAVLCLAGTLGCEPAGEWNETFHRPKGWRLADGGASTRLSDGRTVWLFGDSFLDGGSQCVDNSIAVQEATLGRPPEPNEIRFFARNADTRPFDVSATATAGMRPWVEAPPGSAQRTWMWPSDALATTSGHLLSIYAEIGCARGEFPACRQYLGDMKFVGQAVVDIENPMDAPDTWRTHTTRLFDRRGEPPSARGLHWGSALLEDAGWLYVFGATFGEGQFLSDVKLARTVPEGLTRYDQWQFLTPGGWQMMPTGPAAFELETVAHQAATELSVDRLSREGRTWFVLVHSDWTTDELVVRSVEVDNVESIRWPGPGAGPGTRRYALPSIDPTLPDSTRLVRNWAGRAHVHLSSRSDQLLMGYFSLQAFGLRFIEVPLADAVLGW